MKMKHCGSARRRSRPSSKRLRSPGTSQSVLTLDDTQPRRAGRRKATVDGEQAFIRCGDKSLHGDDPIAVRCKVENGKATLLDVPNDRWRVGVLWDIPGGKLSLDSEEIGPTWSLELTAEPAGGG